MRVSSMTLLTFACLAVSLKVMPAKAWANSSSNQRLQNKKAAEEVFGEQLLLKMAEPPLAKSGAAASKILLKGALEQDAVAVRLEQLGLACAILQGPPGQLVVQSVRPGTAAYYKEFCEGDVIRSIAESQGHISIGFFREGKLYQLVMAAPGGAPVSGMQVQHFFASISHFLVSKPESPSKKQKRQPETGQSRMVEAEEDPDETDRVLTKVHLEFIFYPSSSWSKSENGAELPALVWCRREIRDLALSLAHSGKSFALTVIHQQPEQSRYTAKFTAAAAQELFPAVQKYSNQELFESLLAKLTELYKSKSPVDQPTLIVILDGGMPRDLKNRQRFRQAVQLLTHQADAKQPFIVSLIEVGNLSQDKDDQDSEDGTSDALLDGVVDRQTYAVATRNGLPQLLVDAVAWGKNQFRQSSAGKSTDISPRTLEIESINLEERKLQRQKLESDLLAR